MKKDNNSILITGGSSGIGLELVHRFINRKNKIVICGRSLEKLEQVKQAYPSVEYLQCDLSVPGGAEELAVWIEQHHPDCNVLINNAAMVHTDSFRTGRGILEKVRAEIETNLVAPIELTKRLLPVLEKNDRPAVINITTGLVYAPKVAYPFYNATKAALHSFTKVLREQLRESPAEVIEVMFPAVDTPWHKGNPPNIAISAGKAVDGMFRGMDKGKQEIRVGGVKLLFLLSRVAPGFAFKKINSLQAK